MGPSTSSSKPSRSPTSYCTPDPTMSWVMKGTQCRLEAMSLSRETMRRISPSLSKFYRSGRRMLLRNDLALIVTKEGLPRFRNVLKWMFFRIRLFLFFKRGMILLKGWCSLKMERGQGLDRELRDLKSSLCLFFWFQFLIILCWKWCSYQP